ncbi:hypothetical protein KO494_08955 [Lacinutrix sp. C3R15]|uniref:hypothetical protein n=1 Tax=Flavobacteriaceae TaxID=49546 RepID=UPI001C0A0BB7|nr:MULTISPECIES: hypothetical protein [Flavobacteriaceae]MBU2939665.1 hypothetical protein [Lacinutrix sp. C3R15]MDO6622980.1 hypothetical protein [Oceanihabitans sp. 1_MG-2023]
MHFLYFDPGLGAMIVQAIVAAVAGVVLFSKGLMYKIKTLLGFSKNQEDDMFDDIEIKDQDTENK